LHAIERALHTVLALCGSCVCAFAASYLTEGKFDMVHIQNATLAGGVAIGSAADMDIGLCAAIGIGSVAGLWSTFGYRKLAPFLENVGIHDTCGVHNLHGMPGLIGGVASIIAVATGASEHLQEDDVSAGEQTGKQVLGLVVSIAIAIVGGLLTGLLCKVMCPPLNELFEDTEFWIVEEDEKPAEAGKYASGAAEAKPERKGRTQSGRHVRDGFRPEPKAEEPVLGVEEAQAQEVGSPRPGRQDKRTRSGRLVRPQEKDLDSSQLSSVAPESTGRGDGAASPELS